MHRRLNIPKVFLVVLYGCKSRSLTLKEEYELQVFESKVLSKFLRFNNVTEKFKILNNDGLFDYTRHLLQIE
jgi:hypothetical protein